MIVVISHAHPSVSKGGAEVAAYALYTGLRRLGLPAAFVAMCPAGQMAQVRFDTPDEHVVPFDGADYDHTFHHAPPSVFGSLRRLLDPLKPSALVFHHFLFLGINTLERLVDHFQCPSALVLHEFLAICQHHGQMVTRPAKRLCPAASPSRCTGCFPELGQDDFSVRKALFLGAFAKLRRLVAPSAFLARRFIDWGVPAERLAVVENGLLRDPLPDGPAPAGGAHPAVPQAPVVFGYFGQINPFKGVDLLLEAAGLLARQVPPVPLRLRIHGNLVGVDAAFAARFEAASAEPDGAVEYAGPYDNTEVLNLMQACDFVVMASRWWENSPVVIQEAYAARRPLVVPGLGGMAEKVQDGVSGSHFRHGDAADLARVLADCAARGRGGYQLPAVQTARDMALHYLRALDLPVPQPAPALPAEAAATV